METPGLLWTQPGVGSSGTPSIKQEEVQDWASHLEHLQSILLEFDAEGAPEESDLIRFFREGLKPSIKAQMEQRGRELDSWE